MVLTQQKPNQMNQAATSITPKYFDVSEKDHYAMEKLRNLKKMYTPSPVIRQGKRSGGTVE